MRRGRGGREKAYRARPRRGHELQQQEDKLGQEGEEGEMGRIFQMPHGIPSLGHLNGFQKCRHATSF